MKKQSNLVKYTHKQLGVDDSEGTLVNGHYFLVENPIDHFSFLPPKNGCGNGSALVRDTVYNKCVAATNAGFFVKKNGDCIGNLISDGQVIRSQNRINANFGITQVCLFFP